MSTQTPPSAPARPLSAPPRRARPEPIGKRLLRGAVAGLVMGAVFVALNMGFVASTGGEAARPFRLISSLGLGAEALPAGNVAYGVLIHVLLSVTYGTLFALIVPYLQSNGTVALAGGLYGGLLYVVNFLILPPLFLAQFMSPNTVVELMAHVVFGHLLALGFYSSGVRSGEPFLALGNRASPTGAAARG